MCDRTEKSPHPDTTTAQYLNQRREPELSREEAFFYHRRLLVLLQQLQQLEPENSNDKITKRVTEMGSGHRARCGGY